MTIELNPEDALMFVEFQKNYKKFGEFEEFYDVFITMRKAGVFDIKNGKAIMNFNRHGQLADVELQYHTYKVA